MQRIRPGVARGAATSVVAVFLLAGGALAADAVFVPASQDGAPSAAESGGNANGQGGGDQGGHGGDGGSD